MNTHSVVENEQAEEQLRRSVKPVAIKPFAPVAHEKALFEDSPFEDSRGLARAERVRRFVHFCCKPCSSVS